MKKLDMLMLLLTDGLRNEDGIKHIHMYVYLLLLVVQTLHTSVITIGRMAACVLLTLAVICITVRTMVWCFGLATTTLVMPGLMSGRVSLILPKRGNGGGQPPLYIRSRN